MVASHVRCCRRGEEAAAAARIAEMEEAALAAEEACSSLNEEADAKGKKLEKLWRKYQASQGQNQGAAKGQQALLDRCPHYTPSHALHPGLLCPFPAPDPPVGWICTILPRVPFRRWHQRWMTLTVSFKQRGRISWTAYGSWTIRWPSKT